MKLIRQPPKNTIKLNNPEVHPLRNIFLKRPSIHTVEFCWAIERNEVPIHATRGMNFKNIKLSEGNQSQKIADCMIPFI